MVLIGGYRAECEYFYKLICREGEEKKWKEEMGRKRRKEKGKRRRRIRMSRKGRN